jgi:hypothetical protein
MTLDAQTIARVMGGDVNGASALVPGPGHSPKDRSLSVKPDPNAPDGILVHSFAGDDFAECRDHVKAKLGITVVRQSGRRIVNTYSYYNEHHQLLFEAVRYEPKSFSQRRPDGHGGWIWNLDGVRRVLYRLPELREAVAAKKEVVVVEGEKDADALRAFGITATTCPSGTSKWRDEYNQHFRGADVVIIGDNDEPGRAHAHQVAQVLIASAERVRVLDLATCWPECPPKGDVSDWLASGGSREQLVEWINQAPEYLKPASPAFRFKPLTLAEFFKLEIKPPGKVLDPIIPEKGLVMVYASRGTGKTYLALGMAYAVATGTQFLKWKAPKARRVLLIDGEMPAAALQERLAKVVQGATTEPADDMLEIISGDLIEEQGVGNLADPKVQAELDPHLNGIELLILDNLSSLTTVIRDNDAESWGPIQSWLLRLRRRGISVLIVHHAGKAVSSAAHPDARTYSTPRSAYGGRATTCQPRAPASRCTWRKRAGCMASPPSRSRPN